jgi:hypothetical protein
VRAPYVRAEELPVASLRLCADSTPLPTTSSRTRTLISTAPYRRTRPSYPAATIALTMAPTTAPTARSTISPATMATPWASCHLMSTQCCQFSGFLVASGLGTLSAKADGE